MKELMRQIDWLLHKAGVEKSSLISDAFQKPVFPFSDAGRLLAYLLSIKAITYEQYLQLQQDYQNRNQYLELFDMSPRTFGETWGERHILSLFPEFIKETKERNPDFDGEYDLILGQTRVEVKACRASDAKGSGNLSSRAYLRKEARAHGFKYHFQQLKPSCCDIFIWIGVCRDQLIYWVLTSRELIDTGKLSPQHRNEHTGTKHDSVFEGQVFMTEEELQPFQVSEREILQTVRLKQQ